MQPVVLNVLQTLLIIATLLWLVAFIVSLATRQTEQLFRWTGHTLRDIWRHAWQLIVGVAIGYWLAGQPLLHVSW